ncbi:MAG TPA: hypothetical protein VGG02_02885 [Chthoniobacterales bacterium]|jgi:hypothetical protein
MRLHVSYGFASLPDAELITFTEGVDTGLDGNPKYPTLPSNATLAMLAAALLAFSTSLPIAKHGGQMDTANKNALRNALIALLYLLAGYVQNACDQDLATLLSSGFKAASQERRREPLPKPATFEVKAGQMDGQVIGAVKPPIPNTSLYEGRAQLQGTTDWLPSLFSGDSRHLIFNGLASGQLYTFQARARGGSMGASE